MKKNEFLTLAEEIKNAINPILNKYGLTYDSVKGIVKSEVELELKIKTISNDTEKIKELEKEEFSKVCYHYSFKIEDYLKTINDNGQILTFVGFNTRATKNPCLLREEKTNKIFSAPISYVKFNMEIKEG